MVHKPKTLIGRYVRLKSAVFKKLAKRSGRAAVLENLFVVAAIAQGVNKVICYGGDMRVTVSPADIVTV